MSKRERDEKNSENAKRPAELPEIPGVGRVKMVRFYPPDSEREDRIYYIDRTQPISVNTTITENKHTHVETSVFINGIEYQPVK